jgi:hypothetical protein
MFWIVLIISAVVVIVFAGVGIDAKGITIFGFSLPLPINTSVMPKADFYKAMFNTLGVSIWLAWVANALALVSTAGIFPDLLTGGSIDLYLSKPISRLRLFITKYIAGLLFVTLQVSIFTTASFLVLGIRGGAWLGGLFLTVPIIVLFFSYLFCISVALGVLTRSTLAALLVTLLIWSAIWVIHTTEAGLLWAEAREQQKIRWYDRRITFLEQRLARMQSAAPTTAAATQPLDPASTAPTPEPTSQADSAATTTASDDKMGFLQRWAKALAKVQPPVDSATVMRAELRSLQQKRAEVKNPWVIWHGLAFGIKTVLPKTTETIELLNRSLAKYAGIEQVDTDVSAPPPSFKFGESPQLDDAATREVQRQILARSLWWIVGTSVGFEVIVLAFAGWIFCRRDY